MILGLLGQFFGLCGSTSPLTWCGVVSGVQSVSEQIFEIVSHETFPDVSLKLYTSTVYGNDCTIVCKTGMDITVKPE